MSSDLKTDNSGQEKKPYEIGRLQNLALTSEIHLESGKWVKKVDRKHVIKGTSLGEKLRGVRMTRRKSVFVYRLDYYVTMDMMNKLVVAPKDTTYTQCCHIGLANRCVNCVDPSFPQQSGPIYCFWARQSCRPAGWLALLLIKIGQCRD